MMVAPVTQARVDEARARGISNVNDLAVACRLEKVPFYVACAIVSQESYGGKNVYGGDKGGVLSKFPEPVNKDNFIAFRYEVVVRGMVSNGVGPMQITYAGPHINGVDGPRTGGYFEQMFERGLTPYVPLDNMRFGLSLWYQNWLNQDKNWTRAASIYNGGLDWRNKASAIKYGKDVWTRIQQWHQWLSD